MAMTENDKINKYGPIVQYVNSRKEPDKLYEIRKKGEVHSCNCKGFIFSKTVPKTCKHINFYLETLGERQETHEATDEYRLIIEEVLRTAGVMGILKSAVGGAEYHMRVDKMAAALKSVGFTSGGLAATTACGTDEIRCITLED